MPLFLNSAAIRQGFRFGFWKTVQNLKKHLIRTHLLFLVRRGMKLVPGKQKVEKKKAVSYVR